MTSGTLEAETLETNRQTLVVLSTGWRVIVCEPFEAVVAALDAVDRRMVVFESAGSGDLAPLSPIAVNPAQVTVVRPL